MKVIHVSAIGFTAKHFLLPQCEYLRRLGHKVGFVFSPDPAAAELREKGFGVTEISISRSISPVDLRAVGELAAYFRRVRPDIVHTHTSKGGVVGRLAARLAGVPHVIHTIHGFPFIEGQSPAKYTLYAQIEKWAAKMTDVLLSQSEEDVKTAVRLGILARQGAPIYIGNGIDLGRFNNRRFSEKKKAEIRRSLGIGDEPVIITVARLTLEKGYKELVEALGRNVEYPWKALFVGPDFGAKSEIKRMVTEQGLTDRVSMLGYRANVDELLAIADIFMLASYREGVPRSVIEAQAMGIPAIVTDIRGCREIVLDGETGMLVPPKNSAKLGRALEDLLYDPEKRKRMGARAERYACERFNERTVFERIAKAYKIFSSEPNLLSAGSSKAVGENRLEAQR